MAEEAGSDDRWLISHPAKRKMRYLPLNLMDRYFAGVVISAAICIWAITDSMGWAVLLALFGAFLLIDFEKLDARVYVWVGELVFDGWIRFVWKDKAWDDNTKNDWFRPRPIKLKANEFGDNSLLYDKVARGDAYVIVVDGSDAVTLDMAGQFARNEQLANAISRTASVGGYRVGFSTIHMRRPLDEFQYHIWMYNNEDPDVLVPAGLLHLDEMTPEEEGDMNLALIAGGMTEIYDVSSDVTTAFVIDLKRPKMVAALERRALKKAKKEAEEKDGKKPKRHKSKTKAKRTFRLFKSKPKAEAEDPDDAEDADSLAHDDASRIPITDIINQTIASLKGCGFANPRCLSLEELHTLLRKGWDCVDIEGFYAERARPFLPDVSEWDEEDGIVSEPTNAELAASQLEQVAPDDDVDLISHWPTKVILKNDCVKFGNTWHAALVLHTTPPLKTTEDVRATLATSVPWFTQSTIGFTVRGDLEYLGLTWWKGISGDAMAQAEVDLGPKADRYNEEMRERQETIDRATFAMDFNVMATASAPTRQELNKRVGELIAHYAEQGCRFKRVKRRCRQVKAVYSVHTGKNLLYH